MPSFQVVVLSIAVVILIIALAFIGVTLRNSQKNAAWPPLVPDCPDYWTMDGSASNPICVNVKNLGTCPAAMGSSHLTMDFNQAQYTGSNSTCAKYTWATGCNLSWDGITYGVPNPCDASGATTSSSTTTTS
jgi:hypothetical protein